MSDSDSDSDYEPILENEEDGIEGKSGEKIVASSNSRKRKAAELWNSMVEEDGKQTKIKMENALLQVPPLKTQKIKKKQQKKLNKMLTQIFGKSTIPSSVTDAQSNSEDSQKLRERAIRSVQSLQRDRKVVETRKFAGQSIQIERNLKAGEALPSESTDAKPQIVSSLDKVLTEIKGPQTISTVTKSSIDWEGYKSTEGIEEEVAAAAKEGYLTRKEFLERCDHRQFENERDERLLKAASRMK